ncbi:hypothetical protein ACJX0J_009981, partial [Zea mays]
KPLNQSIRKDTQIFLWFTRKHNIIPHENIFNHFILEKGDIVHKHTFRIRQEMYQGKTVYNCMSLNLKQSFKNKIIFIFRHTWFGPIQILDIQHFLLFAFLGDALNNNDELATNGEANTAKQGTAIKYEQTGPELFELEFFDKDILPKPEVGEKEGRYGAEIQHKGSIKISKKHAPFQQRRVQLTVVRNAGGVSLEVEEPRDDSDLKFGKVNPLMLQLSFMLCGL